jgi:peptidoglycan/LPS O-acetylase OafA/YrhL
VLVNHEAEGRLKTERLPALDGLRAFAVGVVFLHHAYPSYFPGGFIGVDLFFVLSGFVITRQLLLKGIDFKRFYWHRATRIIPPIIPVLVFSAITVFAGLQLVTPVDILFAVTGLLNWARAFSIEDGGMLGHFWSLAVEEQFYLVWPLTLLILLRSRVSLAPKISVIVLVAVAIQIATYVVTEDHFRVYNGSDTRFSQLAMGCLLAVVPQVDLKRLWVLPIVYFSVVVLKLDHAGAGYLTWGIPFSGIVAMLLISIAAWSRTPLNFVLEHPLMQWAGSRSYAMYLWHYPMLLACFKLNVGDSMLAVVPIIAALTLTCLAAELSYRFVERPARALRDKVEANMAKRKPELCETGALATQSRNCDHT